MEKKKEDETRESLAKTLEAGATASNDDSPGPQPAAGTPTVVTGDDAIEDNDGK